MWRFIDMAAMHLAAAAVMHLPLSLLGCANTLVGPCMPSNADVPAPPNQRCVGMGPQLGPCDLHRLADMAPP